MPSSKTNMYRLKNVIQPTYDIQGEQFTLRGEAVIRNTDVINTTVAPLVGEGVGHGKQEVGRVIDSLLDVGVRRVVDAVVSLVGVVFSR